MDNVNTARVILPSRAWLVATLSLLSAFAPLVTDMYLPALPGMIDYFGASASLVQMGLSSCMLGMALGQLLFGPISDRSGRRVPLLVSLVMFAISTVMCVYSHTITFFIAMRFLQGISAAGGLVLSRSIATDHFSGRELGGIMALMGALGGIAPIASPVIGGVVLSFTSWPAIFVILLVIGLIILGFSSRVPESLPPERRVAKVSLSSFVAVASNRRYRVAVLVFAFTMVAFFGNISSSPFIIQTVYGFSEFSFSMVFAANAVVIAIFSMLSSRISPMHAIRVGIPVVLTASVLQLINLVFGGPFACYEGLTVALHAGLGLLFPTLTAIAMDSERGRAGTASALMGAAQFVAGGLAAPLVGLGDIRISTGCVLVAGTLLAFIVYVSSPSVLSGQANSHEGQERG